MTMLGGERYEDDRVNKDTRAGESKGKQVEGEAVRRSPRRQTRCCVGDRVCNLVGRVAYIGYTKLEPGISEDVWRHLGMGDLGPKAPAVGKLD